MSAESALDALHPAIAEAMTKKGFLTLTAVQEKVLDPELLGRDLRIASQTGSGKTLAVGFVIAPDLEDSAEATTGKAYAAHPRAILIAPTRELAAQLGRELSWLYEPLKARVVVVAGGSNVKDELRALGHKPRVIVGTPGRLLDHLTRGAIDASAVRSVVLDEADQMLDLGFREELEAILEKLPEARRTHLVSATFSREVLSLAANYQEDAVLVEGTGLGKANVDISYSAHLVRPHDRQDALVNLLLMRPDERCLIFVRTRAEASELAERLGAAGFRALPISGELEQRERNKTLEAFRNGMIKILVATDVAARGLDIEDVSLVVHYDLPGNPEDLTHRSGRTGRAGKKGTSVLLVPPQARDRTERLLRRARIDARWHGVPTADDVLKAADDRLIQELEQNLSEVPEPRLAAFAERLVGLYDPPALVAALLARVGYRGPVEPRQVKVLELDRRPREPREDLRPRTPRPPPHRREPQRRDEGSAPREEREPQRFERQGRAPHEPRGEARPEHRGRPGRDAAPETVAFRLSYGQRDGADPRRLMAIVCRWGRIAGDRVGAIRIGDTDSTFEIALDAASDFARATSRPDPRNPKLQIEELRHRGAKRSGKPFGRVMQGEAPPRRRKDAQPPPA
ncbi:MAG: DEAD/DEAH box helicase [Myxococcota bacterium]